MIDRDNRDRLADLLERLLRAEITFDRYEQELGEARFEESEDSGVVAVCHAADNVSEEAGARAGDHLTAEKFSTELIRNVRRTALFLRSDSEFEWPPLEQSRTRAVALLEIWAAVGIAVIPLADVLFFGSQSSGFFGCIFAIVNAAASWTAAKQLQRLNAEDNVRRMTENRDLEAWPFARRADVPTELLA